MKTLYTAKAQAKSGRDGSFTIENSSIGGSLSLPKELGGPGGTGANPEQLFAAGYAACFGSAIKHVAMKKKLNIEAPVVSSEVSIGTNDSGGFGLAVKLFVQIPGTAKADVEALTKEAHQVCPYSNAVRGNVPVEITVS